MLRELDRLTEERAEFAFETRLSGLGHVKRISGYLIEIAYLRLASTQLAISRVAARVRQVGHDVSAIDVVRRFKRGGMNFLSVYKPLADGWTVYENSGTKPILLERGTMTTKRKSPKKPESFSAGVRRGLRQAARATCEVARMHGHPIYNDKLGQSGFAPSPRR